MYKPTIWQDHVEGVQDGTDMSAANFNNLEIGAMEANALAALNAAERRYCSDAAKNSETVLVFDGVKNFLSMIPDEGYIAFPSNAIRNTTDYRVTWDVYELRDVNNAKTAGPYLITIKQKQANGFTFSISGPPTLSVRFYISGGMI
jgi:hypothetical protein